MTRAMQPGSVRLLSDEAAVRDFLATRLQADPSAARIEFLSGGVSSAIVRVLTDDGCFVIKQALPQLRVAAAWRSRPERSGIEARCADVLDRIVPGSVPEVLRVVPEAHAFVMACAPRGSEPWKAQLLRGEMDLGVAAAAGTLLGRIHDATASDPTTAAAFADRSFFEELRVDPYLRHTAAKHPDLADELGALAAALEAPGMCLVHGDFSPKNILLTPARDLLLIDHEVAHWGQPAFDVAFALSHLCLKAVHFRDADRYVAAADAFLAAYRAASSVAVAATGELGGALLAALMLARVDGKSPVEYLTEDDREVVRTMAGRALRHPAASPETVLATVREAAADD